MKQIEALALALHVLGEHGHDVAGALGLGPPGQLCHLRLQSIHCGLLFFQELLQEAQVLLQFGDHIGGHLLRLVHVRKLLTGVHKVLRHLVSQVLLLKTHLGDQGQDPPVPHVLQVHEVFGDREHEDDGAQGHEEHLHDAAGVGQGGGDVGDVEDVDEEDVTHVIALPLSKNLVKDSGLEHIKISG